MGSKPSKKRIRSQEQSATFRQIDENCESGEPAKNGNISGNAQTTPEHSAPGTHGAGEGEVLEEMPTNTDVMISYSHMDKEMMQSIKESLIKNGLKVWVDVVGLSAGVNFLSKIGEAIIDSKAFITLLSENSIKSKYCQDELALAYISNKPIFPIGMKSASELVPLMDTGMRLQLAGMKWTIMENEVDFRENFDYLLGLLLEEIKLSEGSKMEEIEERPGSALSDKLRKATNRYRFYTRQTSREKNTDKLAQRFTESPAAFWERHFKSALEIPWSTFMDALVEEFHEDLDATYNDEDQEWLKNILYREMEVDETDGLLENTSFLNFCTVEDELQALWKRIEDQARESYAMREVFNMKSSVRIQAIENLAKIKSPAVIDALRDLLDDLEPNVRAVAAISLAKTGINDRLTIKRLLKTLNDKDRLVREAGCIALGRLKAGAAVPRLVHIWRNDVISSVRNAAELALNQISGPEVEKAMHITRILTEEIRTLSELGEK